ncbi:hypothetical protein RHBI111906_07195 [Rhodothermus bifroesti]|nr:hypothetical protein HRbin18_02012 [bacterium HR18]
MLNAPIPQEFMLQNPDANAIFGALLTFLRPLTQIR